MQITFWGTRGSVPTPGPDTIQYGGNTCCLSIECKKDPHTLIILDAGTGIRLLGESISDKVKKIYILLSHLHLDHILGLGFFMPLYQEGIEIHFVGPANALGLRQRLSQYMSQPLFPVMLNDLPSRLFFHEISTSELKLGAFSIRSEFIIHPGLTVGYRIKVENIEMAYMPDHEPILGYQALPQECDWISGYNLAHGVDLLIHDAQYTETEYKTKIGWGHSSVIDALKFATLAKIKNFIPIHYDPTHNDKELDKILTEAVSLIKPAFPIYLAKEGVTIELGLNGCQSSIGCWYQPK